MEVDNTGAETAHGPYTVTVEGGSPGCAFGSWCGAVFGAAAADLSVSGPDADPDADGHTNLQEFNAGTNPLDPQSVLKVLAVRGAAGAEADVAWSSVAGKRYRIEVSTDLSQGFAPAVEGIDAAGGETSATAPVPPGAPQVFYRVVAE